MFKSLTQVLQDLKMSISFVFMLKTHILYDSLFDTCLKIRTILLMLVQFFCPAYIRGHSNNVLIFQNILDIVSIEV